MLGEELFRTRGRAPKPLNPEIVRELEESDLALLAEEKGSKPSALKRLTDRHHALARNLSSGMGESQAAAIVGYSLSRVSILKADPAFQELLTFYRSDVDAQYRDLHAELSGLASDAAREISDRLELEPEKFTVNQLLEVTKLGADRTGHGPTNAGPVTNNNFVVALPPKATSVDEWSLAHTPKTIEHKE